MDCHTLLAKIDERLEGTQRGVDDVAERVETGNTRLAAFGERIAATEQDNKALWRGQRALEERLKNHLEECPGRVYAMERMVRRQRVSPDTADDATSRLITAQIQSMREEQAAKVGAFAVPRWLLYLGIGIGVAVAVAGWAWGALQSGGLGALVSP